MKVNISSIREMRGGVLHFEGQQNLPDYKMDLNFTDPIQVKGTITNTGDGFLVQANLSFKYQVSCSRCLKEFTNLQETAVVEQYIPGIVLPEDDSVFHFSGDLIDLKDCMNEHVLINLPMSFVCDPECLGLCPDCGRNLNIESCQCPPKEINPQFAKLRNLLSTEGGGANGKSKK